MPVTTDDSETRRLVDLAAGGNGEAWTQLYNSHQARLRSMVAVRMDRRLRGRIDPSDVLQEACIVASKHIAEYAADPSMPFYLWLRWITGQRLLDQHRRHLGAQARGVNRELSLYHGAFPEATTADLAAHLLGRLSTPSSGAMRIEQKIRLQEALNSLEPIDREILALRHFEELSNGEAAQVLGLDKSAASKRYARALVRLKDVLMSLPGSQDWMP
ncbi:sigma-70 family RNA polymerase sigma factor [Aeoliella sp. ICT_H6.2]|uniref:Sigma-70 family RNA polymerase sigma factor n=1 Tax=Aeoliella straminimaris TaxID=2954799 RepID=A0A9X2JHK2_9BACT|nr:sigma-70 family RNA polymerase sigma factor [Aeoliella straminimaris]MCO6046135.1 sigma-70 family RNA polymerase sigma factor [Aeoliella straminimaris]